MPDIVTAPPERDRAQLAAALVVGGSPADRCAQATGGGEPSALAASAGSHSQITHACRNAERANSTAAAWASPVAPPPPHARPRSPSPGPPGPAAGGGPP